MLHVCINLDLIWYHLGKGHNEVWRTPVHSSGAAMNVISAIYKYCWVEGGGGEVYIFKISYDTPLFLLPILSLTSEAQ